MAERGRSQEIKASNVRTFVLRSKSATKNFKGSRRTPKMASIPSTLIASRWKENQLRWQNAMPILATNDVLNKNAIAVPILITHICGILTC